MSDLDFDKKYDITTKIDINEFKYTIVYTNHSKTPYYEVNTKDKMIKTNMIDIEEVINSVREKYSKN